MWSLAKVLLLSSVLVLVPACGDEGDWDPDDDPAVSSESGALTQGVVRADVIDVPAAAVMPRPPDKFEPGTQPRRLGGSGGAATSNAGHLGIPQPPCVSCPPVRVEAPPPPRW